jgi:hypothetical protein
VNTLLRIRRLTIIIGLVGTAAVLLLRGWRAAVGFLAGAAFSLISLRSWMRLSEGVGAGSAPSVRAHGLFLALRYVLLTVGLYVIVNVLGITPVVIIVGLLVSFAAVILGLVYESMVSK